MKKQYIVFIALTIVLSSLQRLGAQNVYIPDENFKLVLVQDVLINTNGDDEIQVTEAIAYEGALDLWFSGIIDLTGIEAFVNINELDCSYNTISNLDLRKNTKLRSLNCMRTLLSELDISSNTLLETLNCSHAFLDSLNLSKNSRLVNINCSFNNLSNLDVSHNALLDELDCSVNILSGLDLRENAQLTELYCNNNELQQLDISRNTALLILNCAVNKLTGLDVWQNTALEDLTCSFNPLTNLDLTNNASLVVLSCSVTKLTNVDVTHNSKLVYLLCAFNPVSFLDVSHNKSLEYLYCQHNQLTTLSISTNALLRHLYCNDNKLTGLDIKNGNNTNLLNFRATNNPSLSCIQVDDDNFMEENFGEAKDFSATYNEVCPFTNLYSWFRDADADGFGDPALSIITSTATPPAGYVSNNNDCNDANVAIHPGAAEICDGIDNDCDGTVDESLMATYFRDADMDGFGDPKVSIQACSVPPGYVNNNTDCVDTDASIYSGAIELCDNKDNDCDGQTDEGCYQIIPVRTVSTLEGNSGIKNILLSVGLSNKSTLPITVEYRTKNKTASAGSDYVAKTGKLTFAANTTLQTISIQVFGDKIEEDNEQFTVEFFNPVNATLQKKTIIANVLDDDNPATPKLMIFDSSTVESAGKAIVRIGLTKPLSFALKVYYHTQNGTAVAPADYKEVAVSTTNYVSFAPGEMDKYVAIPLVNDNVSETTEYFYVNLIAVAPLNATTIQIGLLGKRSAKVTLQNSPTIVLRSTEHSADINTFTVVASPNPSSGWFNLNIRSTNDGTASVYLTDVAGRRVQAFEKVKMNANLQVGNNLAKGIYFAEITTGKKREVVKLIKVQ